MQVGDQTQAILLLTAWFGAPGDSGPVPLSPKEWGRFALFLREIGRQPADLLQASSLHDLLGGLDDKKVTIARIQRLIDRSAALGIALEKWERAGLWVMTRSDPDYPKRWKERLKHDAPPVLFGAGNRDLLAKSGVAVVGSRDLDASQLTATGKLGREIAFQGWNLISGGARGADEAAMQGALEAEGTAVGILADSLLQACVSTKFRKALMREDLALVSTFNPEAGFNVGNAMARNKYIYCLADAAIVIAASENKGGTWSGAVEDLKRAWVPLWVRRDEAAGNHALVALGARWLPDELDASLLMQGGAQPRVAPPGARVAEEPLEWPPDVESNVAVPAVNRLLESAVADVELGGSAAGAVPESHESPYQSFLIRLGELIRGEPKSAKEIQAAIRLKQRQLSNWLKQAEADGVVERTGRPSKYRLVSPGGQGQQGFCF